MTAGTIFKSDHDSLAADRQIRRISRDLAIPREHFVMY
jgi:hypothetical protein